MDLRKLKKLIELVEESGISELEITEGEEKVRINRGATTNQPQINQITTRPEFHQPYLLVLKHHPLTIKQN